MDEQADFDAALLRAQENHDEQENHDDNEASGETSNLPVPLGPRSPRPSLIRLSPTASFVSHLIAEKHHMAPQRDKRRDSVDNAVDAYAAKAASTVVRMPTGYRKTVVA